MIIDKILQITDRITPSIVKDREIERLKEIRGENKHIDFDRAPDKECPIFLKKKILHMLIEL